MEIIRVAKERQAAEAAKNASNLLEELDREKNLEESKKAAAARKREKKKRKKMEKLAEKGLLPPDQGNLFRSIVNWSLAARSVVQGPKKGLVQHFQ